jgi:conjugative transfer signal peptidase TraF
MENRRLISTLSIMAFNIAIYFIRQKKPLKDVVLSFDAWKKPLAMLGIYLFIYFIIGVFPYSIRINTTNSVPYTLFLSKQYEGKELIQNQYVTYRNPLDKRIKLVKKVMGIPGDRIKANPMYVVVADRAFFIERETKSGYFLSPLEDQVIPDREFFLGCDHPEGFDSRYADHGLVSSDKIEEVLWPIF